MLCNLGRVDYEFDSNIALEFAPALTIVEIFDRVRTHCETVIFEPVDEGPGETLQL
jgi:hypothetical protein